MLPEHLAEYLLQGSHCSSQDEANVVSEVILGGVNIKNVESSLSENLAECLGIAASQANELAKKILRGTNGSDTTDSHDADESSVSTEVGEENFDPLLAEDDDDGVLLGEGECELCDRYIKLTRHHLIPRSTWPRLQKLLLAAAAAKEKGDTEKALEKLGPGLEDRYPLLADDKSSVRCVLQSTCDICRACHDAVHKTHTNIDLALFYNSIDKLLGDARISKFCKWANKQRPRGKQKMTP